jgi:hypothetical protein
VRDPSDGIRKQGGREGAMDNPLLAHQGLDSSFDRCEHLYRHAMKLSSFQPTPHWDALLLAHRAVSLPSPSSLLLACLSVPGLFSARP